MNSVNIFFGSFFEDCLNKYANIKSNKKNVNANEFGIHFIEILDKIYDNELLGPFLKKDKSGFLQIVKQYGLLEGTFNDFILTFEELGEWMKVKNKTYIISDIEKKLLDMLMLKCKYNNLDSTYFKSFEKELYVLTNPRKIFSALDITYSKDQNATINYYNFLLNSMNRTKLIRKKPDFLPDEYYINNGLKLDEVKNMDDDTLAKLNETILTITDNNSASNGGRTTTISDMITKVLKPQEGNASGSGFVDALLLTGIIATIIMIIVVICIYFGVK